MSSRFRLRSRRLSTVLLWTAIAIVLAALLVPLFHADRFQDRIRAALESALGRKVEIGEVALSLLPAPGFELQNVIIGEDPSFGAEYFAYMRSMQARLRLRALWTGRVELASLTLVGPSINLVKNAQGRWNFEGLLEPAGAGAGRVDSPGGAPYFPYIGIDEGRVNFKFGDYKSVFNFQEVEAAVSPPRDTGGRWRLRFAGRPARTGRALSGMGRIRGDGYLQPVSQALSMELELENSPMGHLLWLVSGRDFGIHGELAARVRLSDVLAGLRVEGNLELRDVHRWDVVPSGDARLRVPFSGRLDVPQQSLELETRLAGPDQGSTQIAFALRNYLSLPQWRAAVELKQVPLDPFLHLAQHLGVSLPPKVEARGKLGGGLVFAGSRWPQGVVRIERSQVLLAGAPPVEVEPLDAIFAGRVFETSLSQVRLGKETMQLAVSGDLDGFRLQSRLTARALRLDAVRAVAEAAGIHWLRSLAAGQWDGQLVYRKEPSGPGAWSGSGTLSKVLWQPDGLESPVRIAQARVRWEPDSLLFDPLSVSLGDMQFSGSYRRAAAGDSCKLRIHELDLAQLDGWLNPQRKQSRWQIWLRALGRSAPQTSSWLKAARIEGAVTVDQLRLRQWAFRRVRTRLSWDGETLALKGIHAEIGAGSLSGAMRARFSGAEPSYHFEAAISDLDLKTLAAAATLPENFRGGSVKARLILASSGRTAADLRASLQAGGVFEGRAITLAGVERQDADGSSDGPLDIRLLKGNFAWGPDGVELTRVRLTVGRDVYQGRASIGGRPRLLFELACEGKPLRLVNAALDTPSAVVP